MDIAQLFQFFLIPSQFNFSHDRRQPSCPTANKNVPERRVNNLLVFSKKLKRLTRTKKLFLRTNDICNGRIHHTTVLRGRHIHAVSLRKSFTMRSKANHWPTMICGRALVRSDLTAPTVAQDQTAPAVPRRAQR